MVVVVELQPYNRKGTLRFNGVGVGLMVVVIDVGEVLVTVVVVGVIDVFRGGGSTNVWIYRGCR